MGRIKITSVKRVGNKLFKQNSDKFKNDFQVNKKLVAELAHVPTKRLRNLIAGHITKLKKNYKE